MPVAVFDKDKSSRLPATPSTAQAGRESLGGVGRGGQRRDVCCGVASGLRLM